MNFPSRAYELLPVIAMPGLMSDFNQRQGPKQSFYNSQFESLMAAIAKLTQTWFKQAYDNSRMSEEKVILDENLD